MACPFPGMDPYLEDPAFWRDFQHRFINCWCEAVADQLPDSYEARLDERVNLVQLSPEIIKLIYPDVSTIPHEFLEEVRETRIDILHRSDRSLVAVLELLSATNKASEGFQEYRAKRKAILLQKVHLVELDLLLGGKRMPLSQPLPANDYFALVSRADNRPNCEVYSWPVRDPLPRIPIPLMAPDADIHVELAKVFQATYERGRYARSLRYGQPPLAPLSQDDARWALALSARK